MKDLENHYIGHDDERDSGSYDYHNEAADALSMFGCLGTCIMIIILLIVGLCSCTPKVVTVREEVPVYLHDTLTNVVVRIDSFVERDSIYYETFIKGDTVATTKYVEKWRTKVKLNHDTVIQIVEVPVKYNEVTEVPILVEHKKSKWNKFIDVIGYISFLGLLPIMILLIYKRVRARGFDVFIKKLFGK